MYTILISYLPATFFKSGVKKNKKNGAAVFATAFFEKAVFYFSLERDFAFAASRDFLYLVRPALCVGLILCCFLCLGDPHMPSLRFFFNFPNGAYENVGNILIISFLFKKIILYNKMEFDSTTALYILLGVCSIIAIILGYRILFPGLSLVGMAVFEAEEYMVKKNKKLGQKVGFVQPTKEQYMYLGTIASHHTNPTTQAEDYVLFQIDIPAIQIKSNPMDIPIYKPIPQPITALPEPIVSIPEPEPIVSIPEPEPEPEPIVSIPEPKKTKKVKFETRLDNSYQSSMSYFW